MIRIQIDSKSICDIFEDPKIVQPLGSFQEF